MSIRINGTKFLADFMKNGTRYRRQFDTDAEAREWEASLRKRLVLGQSIADLVSEHKPTGLSVREILDETYRHHWANTKNERHQRVNIKQIETFFGYDTPIVTITTDACDEFLRHLEKRNLSPSSINSRLSTLSKALKFAADRGHITNRPVITRQKVGNNARLRFFSHEEEYEILDALTADGRDAFAEFFRWSIDTGMRPIEARNIPTKAVRYDDELGWLVDLRRTKNSYPRTIPLTDRAYNAFVALSEDSEYPFARFTEANIRSNWKFVREAVGDTDPEFVFYLTRHTCASRLVQRKVDLYTVKEFMGHKTYEMTMRYAKLSPRNMIDAKEALQQTA